MICPHCNRRQGRRERSGNRCGSCGRGFVFEPHDHPGRLNDVRVRRADAWLSSEGRFRYTVGQLGAAVAGRHGVPPTFREAMLHRWPQVHGSLPAGLVAGQEARAAPRPADAAAHVLCPDTDVRDCLLANDVQRIFGVLVVGPDDPPDGPEPVLLFDTFIDGSGGARRRANKLRRGGRRVIGVGPGAAGTRLIQVRPATLLDWLDLTVRAEARFRDGARRAAGVDFLNWPAPPP